MKTIALLIIFASIAVAGYYGYNSYQQQLMLQQSAARFEQEKQALLAAQASNDIAQLNQFIADHPQSDWLEKATYERDKLAYHQAIQTDQIAALEKFINEYRSSQWINQAQNRLQRLRQEAKLQAEIALKQQKLELQRQQLAEQQAAASTGELEEKPAQLPAPAQVTNSINNSSSANNSLSSRDRVARALAIYQKQRQQEQHTDTEQQKQDQKQAQQDRRCQQIKDQIAQYNNRRIKWYDLDGSGKRVYLNKQQVSRNRKQIQEEYKQNCE